MFELDKACQEVVAYIQQQQASGVSEGDVIGVPGCKSKHYRVVRMVSPLELKQIKKEFLNLSKLHPPKKSAQNSYEDAFLDFLNTKMLNE